MQFLGWQNQWRSKVDRAVQLKLGMDLQVWLQHLCISALRALHHAMLLQFCVFRRFGPYITPRVTPQFGAIQKEEVIFRSGHFSLRRLFSAAGARM